MLTLSASSGAASASARFKAVTRDDDADGRVDHVLVTEIDRAAARARHSITVTDYRVLDTVIAARGTRATVRLAEGPNPDTSARPRVSIFSGAREGKGRALDRAPPILTAAVSTGATTGRDAITLTWSEAVRAGSTATAAFQLEPSGGSLTVRSVRDATLKLDSSRSVRPGRLVYRPAGRTSRVSDLSGNGARARRIDVVGTAGDGPPIRSAGPASPTQAGGAPAPTADAPADPAPVDPAPVDPAPVDPAPVDPAPAEPPRPPNGPLPSLDAGDQPVATLDEPIDPAFLTGLSFGDRSHWLQPWRAYLDTPPAARLRDALGINFDAGPDRAPVAARLLRRSGFARARIEIGWCDVSFESSSQLRDPAAVRARLQALVSEGLRPLVLLNAHHGCPGPMRSWSVHLTHAAQQGDRSIEVDATSAAQIDIGRSGLNAQGGYKAAATIFTSVDGGHRVTLSKPLASDLEAGAHPASTLRYKPFERPLQPDGRSAPGFEATLEGWLRYVDLVTRETRAAVGSDAFDVEVWNELGFGSDFLDASTYYDTSPDIDTSDTTRVILERTVAWLRDPVHGRSGVGIGSGFSNQRPWDSGATSPAGLTAIDKHPYPPIRQFPVAAVPNGIRPLDSLGRSAGVQDASGSWRDDFVPDYRALFPEYYLSAIQTESLVRDLAPITTTIYGTPHGRLTAPAGSPSPEVWLTEMNVEQTDFERRAGQATASDVARFQAKVALRTLTAYVNKGAAAVDFYAATAPGFALIAPSFWSAASDGTWSVEDGGTTLTAMRRLMDSVDGPEEIGIARPLTLDSIGDFAARAEWEGDGSPAHPSLMHRDLLAFLPFQTSARSWAVPIYVMTRDMARRRGGGFDLPEERYRLRIGGVSGNHVSARATDPLDGSSVPLEVVSRAPNSVTLDIKVTDSPRVLELSENG